MRVLSETSHKGRIRVERMYFDRREEFWRSETVLYKAKIEHTIEKKGKTNGQIMKELHKLSKFANDPKIWLIINII